jgi:hypothetical protein
LKAVVKATALEWALFNYMERHLPLQTITPAAIGTEKE